jgi:hypothetical protein
MKVEENITLVGLGGTPIIVAVLQAVKGLGVPAKFMPFIAMLMGLGWNVLLTAGTNEFDRTAAALGIVVGLAASGLFDLTAATIGSIRKNGGKGGTNA